MYGHRYTEEEKKFMTEYVPGHSYREIQKAFTERLSLIHISEPTRLALREESL